MQVAILREQMRYAEAIPFAAKAAQIAQYALSHLPPETDADTRAKVAGAYGEALGTLGELYKKLGLYAQADPIYLAVRQLFSDTFGPKDDNTAAATNNLADLYPRSNHGTPPPSLFI